LSPVSAVLLVGTNLRTFGAAGRQLQARQVGLPVLYTAIATMALASGQFLSCALMSWCYRFWQQRLRLDLAAGRRELLEELVPRPRSTCVLTPDGGEVRVPVDRLQPGDRVVLEAGATVPADGRVIGGKGIVDERGVRGVEGASRKSVGDSVLAGATVLTGSLRVEVREPGDRTRARSIERALLAATGPRDGSASTPPATHAERFAQRAVAPALATAGLGLLVGDMTAAGAILAPDYATGPGLATALETLRNAAHCARRGIVLRHPDVLDLLANVDLIVLDDEPSLGRLELEVAGVETELPEAELLRYAASALRQLADDRSAPLNAACRVRRVHLLDLPPDDFRDGVSVVHGRRRIRVREYAAGSGGSRDSPSAALGMSPLVVEIDGRPAGVIRFERSARPAAASALRRIRELTRAPIALVSSRPEPDVAALAAELGVDLYKSGFRAEDTAAFLGACRESGIRTAFVGHRGRQNGAAAEADIDAGARAHVAISVVDEVGGHPESAAVLLLQPDLALLADLWDVARAHEGRLDGTRTHVLVPNVLCVAGAFLFGFTSLTAVILTNLGTFTLYSHAVGSLGEPGRTGRNRRPYPSLAR
jgi:Cu2+-exporting ATPase